MNTTLANSSTTPGFSPSLLQALGPAAKLLLFTTVLAGIVYPALVWLGAQAMPAAARGSLARNLEGQVVGSRLIGQKFNSDGYFHARPAAIDPGAYASGASNLGPTSRALKQQLVERSVAYRAVNSLGAGVAIPADAVSASASGLDPDISVEDALLQSGRVAKARGLDVRQVRDQVLRCSRHSWLGSGIPLVNVLELNIALESALP